MTPTDKIEAWLNEFEHQTRVYGSPISKLLALVRCFRAENTALRVRIYSLREALRDIGWPGVQINNPIDLRTIAAHALNADSEVDEVPSAEQKALKIVEEG